MSRRKRTIVAIGVIEVLLAGLWFWLAQKVLAHPQSASPDAQAVIGQTIGAAMGVVAGLAVRCTCSPKRPEEQSLRPPSRRAGDVRQRDGHGWASEA